MVTLVGVIAGLLLGLVTILLSRSDISGNGWSLSGNASLVIPFGVGPAVVAGGWSAIVLRMRDHPRWIQLGILSGLFGLAFVAASFLSLIVFGPGARDLGATAALLFGFLLYGWLLGGPVVAALIDAPDSPRPGPPIWSVVGILVLPLSLVAGCTAGTTVLAG